MSSINPIHTPCKECVFAEYNGLTQTGCHLDYLNKYANKECEILEVYDDEKEFYVINDKKCLGYRENSWLKKNNLGNATIEDRVAKFKETNKLHYLMLVDLKQFTEDKFRNLCDVMKRCEFLPDKIIFIRYQNNIGYFTYGNITQFLSDANLKSKWRIQTMVDDSETHENIVHNACNTNKGYRFLLSITEDSDDIIKVTNLSNNIVYEQLDPLTVVANRSESVVLFSAPTYRWSIVVERKDILLDKANFIYI